MSRFYLILGEALFMLVLCVAAIFMFRQHPAIAGAVHADIKLSDTTAQVYLQKDSTGRAHYFIYHPGRATEEISSDELADRIYAAGKSGGVGLFFGGTSAVVLFWLGIGLVGQLLFTGRMVVQWIASERKGASIVPPMFWWMSLIGSVLLLAYFLWRRDPIGLLGQAFGSFVYLRNIIWILEGKTVELSPAVQAEDPMPEA